MDTVEYPSEVMIMKMTIKAGGGNVSKKDIAFFAGVERETIRVRRILTLVRGGCDDQDVQTVVRLLMIILNGNNPKKVRTYGDERMRIWDALRLTKGDQAALYACGGTTKGLTRHQRAVMDALAIVICRHRSVPMVTRRAALCCHDRATLCEAEREAYSAYAVRLAKVKFGPFLTLGDTRAKGETPTKRYATYRSWRRAVVRKIINMGFLENTADRMVRSEEHDLVPTPKDLWRSGEDPLEFAVNIVG
jgi:hypothetical protein